MKTILSTILLIFSAICLNSQMVIFQENMGTPVTNTSVTSHVFQNSSPITFDGTLVTVRNTSASSGYLGASGNGNIWFPSGTADFQIFGINTLGYSNITLTFGALTSVITSTLSIQWSTNGGTTWSTPINSTPLATSWSLSGILDTLPSVSNLSLKFSKTGTTTYRLDDVKLTGIPVATNCAIIPVFTSNTATNVCPATTVNLGSFVSITTSGTDSLTWHTDTLATNANRITNLNVAPTGSYYAAFKNSTANCYSGTFKMTLSPTNCNIVHFYTEHFGSPTTTTTFSAYSLGTAPATFERAAPIVYSGSGDIRNTSPSTNTPTYSNPTPSGSGNCFLTSTAGTNLLIEGINTTAYDSLQLSFGIFKNSSNPATVLTIEISTDGVNFSPLSYPGNALNSQWSYATASGVIPRVPNLRIRFTNNTTAQFRIDDIRLSGVPAPLTPCSNPPILNKLTAQNTCPSNSVNLANEFIASGLQASERLTFHTASPATPNNRILNTNVNAGTYFVAIFDSAANCFSNTVQITTTYQSCNMICFFGENMLTVPATTVIAAHTFQNSPSILYSGTGDVRITDTSTIASYPQASGGANVFLTNTSNPRTFTLQNINTSAYDSIELRFGHKTSVSPSLLLVSAGPDTNTLTVIPTSQPNSTFWSYVKSTSYVPSLPNLFLRFLNPSSLQQMRIDDIALCGVPKSLCQIRPILPLDTLRNICPDTTINLSMAFNTLPNKPANHVIQFHSDSNATQNNHISTSLTQSGIYYVSYRDTVNQCYSKGAKFHAIITKPCSAPCQNILKDTNFAICKGNFFRNTFITQNRIIVDTFKIAGGCDSIVRYFITAKDTSNTTQNIRICNGASYMFNGILRNTTGTFTDTLVNHLGCDSFITLNLTVLPQGITINKIDSFCTTTSYQFLGKTYTQAGQYFDTLRTPEGCDSVYFNIVLTTRNCSNICTFVPNVSDTLIENNCPANTISNFRNRVQITNNPAGAVTTWHFGPQASNANRVSFNNITFNTTLYVSFFDSLSNCYSPTTKVLFVVKTCPCTIRPNLSAYTISNICPDTTRNLANINAFNRPSGTVLSWHTDSNATQSNRLTNLLISQSGNYYASFYDTANNCFSPTRQITFNRVTCAVPCDTSLITIRFVQNGNTLAAVVSGAQMPINYQWNNGVSQPQIIISQSGTYCVTIIDSLGCSKTACISAQFVPPVASVCGIDARFGFSVATNGTVHFKDSSINNSYGLTYFWDFGDGTTSFTQNPSKTYTQAGTYNVRLIIYAWSSNTSQICADTLFRAVSISQSNPCNALIPNFTWNQTGTTYSFVNTTNLSGWNVTSTQWVFSDGFTFNFPNPTRVMSIPGTYLATLTFTATNIATGLVCTRSISRTIIIRPQNPCAGVKAGFSWSKQNYTISYTNTSQGLTGNSSVVYKFGNGDTSNLLNGSYTYTQPGYYRVVQIVRSTVGSTTCVDSTVRFITISTPNLCKDSGYVSSMNCGTYVSPVCGCDSITYTNACLAAKAGVKRTRMGRCANSSNFITLCGNVILDKNANCALDATDNGIQNIRIRIQGTNNFVRTINTNSQGFYSVDLPVGTYSITQELSATGAINQHITQLCPAGAITVNANTGGQTYCGNNFYDTARNCPDLSVRITSSSTTTPGFVQIRTVHYQNNSGVAIPNAVLKYRITNNTTLTPSTSTYSSFNGQIVSWNLGTVPPLGSGSKYVWSQVPVNYGINVVSIDSAWIEPTAADCNLSNNSVAFVDTSVGSYDPNDKASFPKGDIDTSVKVLTYHIRFQNTGNAPAHNVRIEDTITDKIDIASLVMTAHSHPCNMILQENRNLIFDFPNIMLPDSATSPEGSQGFVTFTARLKEGLPLETSIQNTAGIYFDFNEPIITNTTENVIRLKSASRIINSDKGYTLQFYPNPVRNGEAKLAVELMNRSQVGYQIFDMHGKLMVPITESKPTNQAEFEMDLKHLSRGSYILQLLIEGKSVESIKVIVE